jgi:hypothetical protein
MSTIYAHTNDGYVSRSGSGWASTRDGASGDAYNSTSNFYTVGVRANQVVGRGGATTYNVTRSFFSFDTSDIKSTVRTATLKIYGTGNSTADIVAVKGASTTAIITTADFDGIDNWQVGSADGSGAGDNESNVTAYSSEISTWSTSGYNDITLNSAAKHDMKNNDNLYICLMEYDHDLKDIAPTTSAVESGLYYADYTGTSRDPKIEYSSISLVPDSNFFGTNF